MGSLLFLLACLDVCFVCFFALPYEISQDSHLIVVVFVEIEAIPMAEADLKEVVV